MRWIRLLGCVLVVASTEAQAENWPQWRGPRADGVSRDKGFPLEWDRVRGVRFKVPLAGRGASTPIVWDDVVLLTYQLGEGPMETRVARERNMTSPWERDYEPGHAVTFHVLALHADTGAHLWEYQLSAGGAVPNVYPTHNLASPSVVTDGELVYAWFGTGQLAALDLEGRVAWTRHLGRDYFPFELQRGHGSSPALHGDTLYLLVDHQAHAMLLALDKKTGEERFRVDRDGDHRSYATPVFVDGPDGGQVIINSNDRVDAYDVRTGAPLWHAGQPVNLAAPTPVFHKGVLYLNRGYSSSPYLALRVGGDVLWRSPTGGPYVSSILYDNGLLYMATERGIASVVDAETGETTWRERLGGPFTASPVAADGRVYFIDEGGETVVLSAGRKPRILARNALEERCLASPALSSGRLFIRTDEHLYAIE